MNCQECLTELATGSLRELSPQSAVMQHCAACPECGPLATALRDREYHAATILNNLPPISNPVAMAETAALVSRRRRLGKIAVFLTGGALIATIWISLFATKVGRNLVIRDRPSLTTETLELSCLSPQQAEDLVTPYLRSPGSMVRISSSGLALITLRGTSDEVVRSAMVIREFENNARAACRYTPFDKTGGALSGSDAAPVFPPTPASQPTPPKKGAR
jgi:hypothetical protein